jgi:hypothetical protein
MPPSRCSHARACTRPTVWLQVHRENGVFAACEKEANRVAADRGGLPRKQLHQYMLLQRGMIAKVCRRGLPKSVAYPRLLIAPGCNVVGSPYTCF